MCVWDLPLGGGETSRAALLLAAGEPSHCDNLFSVDAHAVERGTMSNWRDYELSVILEANEPAVEEMINARH